MRQIKFRVYDNVMNRHNRDQQTFFLDGYGDLWMDRDPKGQDMSGCSKIYKAPNRWVYEQYTGLKDKNGKEIYEGDKLSNNYNTDKEIVREVQFKKGKWILVRTKGTSRLPEILSLYDFHRLNYEVIGNIHE